MSLQISTNNRLKKNYCNELIVEQIERILFIKLNRPAVKNALNRRAVYGIVRALNEAANDSTISIVVLTSAISGIFSAGADLKQIKNYANDIHKYFRDADFILRMFIKSLIHFKKVIVAVVDGPCIGIGFTLCALCDIVYCTKSTYFEAPFVQIGISPEGCSTYLFPAILGRSKANEILLFGERMTAQVALQFNFVSNVYDVEELEAILYPKLLKYSMLPEKSLLLTKKLLQKPEERQLLLNALKDESVQLKMLRYSDEYLKTLEEFVNRNNKSKL